MIPDYRHKTFGFLMFPGYEELDMIGPWEMGTMWHAYAKGPKCVTVAEKQGEMTCAKGLRTIADHSLENAPKLDFLLVPGGFSALEEAERPVMTDYLAKMALSVEHLMSVCTGSLMLEAAGLLKGKRATTHWKLADRLREADGVTLVQDRYVRDGNIWTSAGVSAGIDMTLGFIAAYAGEHAASVVQHNAEYYPDQTVFGRESQSEGSPDYARRLLRETA